MQERNSPLRFLGHLFTAALIAVAVAGGIHLWQTKKAAQSASSAELSLDPDAARKIDPGLADAAEPATALAQSYLSDPVIAGLSKQAWLSTADIPTRVGEFRSRLQLTQPSSGLLLVEFRDPDVTRSASTANAVARALVSWAPPSSAPAPTAAAPPTPAPAAATPAPAPAPKPVAAPPQNSGALAAGLSALEAQLSSTNRKLDDLSSSGGRAGHGGYAREQSSYSESEQQRLIKTDVAAARKKLDDLRAQATKESLGVGTKEHLEAIQEALSSILAPQGSGFRAAGIDARQLRRERTALTNAISVVAEQRQAIEKQEAAQPASASSPTSQPAATAPAPAPAPAPPQPAPVAPVASSGSAQQSPFAEVRLAGPGARVVWWPSLALGLLCTLPYLIAVSLRRRPAEDETDDTSVIPRSGSRFITPDEPVRVAPLAPAPAPTPTPAPNPFVSTPGRRASFSWDPDPAQNPAPATVPAALLQEKAAAAEEVRDISTDPPPLTHENVVAMTDPWDSWTDEIRKTLSETSIGRALSGSDATAGSGEAANPGNDATPRPSTRPDRLAG